MKYYPRWAVPALFIIVLGASTLVHAAPVTGQGTWETTLQGRDLDGNMSTFEAYYDTALNITWLADADYAQTSGYDADGFMTWSTANSWATSLNINGITGWRLPTVTDTGLPGCDPAYGGTDCGYNVQTTSGSTVYSEMASLWYDTLGNIAYCNTSGACPQPGWAFGPSNTGPFSNVLYHHYWSGTEYSPSEAWQFYFYDGFQDTQLKGTSLMVAWAVHSGDVAVSAVPVPAATWLFGSGLAGLIGFARRRKRAV